MYIFISIVITKHVSENDDLIFNIDKKILEICIVYNFGVFTLYAQHMRTHLMFDKY